MLAIQAELGQLEVSLRRGKPDVNNAADLVTRARECDDVDRRFAEDLWSAATALCPQVLSEDLREQREDASINELLALAKLCRALGAGPRLESGMAVPRGGREFDCDFWRELITNGEAYGVRYAFNLRDKLDFELAWLAASSPSPSPVLVRGNDCDREERAKDEGIAWFRDEIKRDIAKLRAAVGDSPHPQIAVRYSVLAMLPDGTGKSHDRARNLREVDRSRSLLAVTALQEISDRLNDESEFAMAVLLYRRDGATQGSGHD
jgi:hypothetical protein